MANPGFVRPGRLDELVGEASLLEIQRIVETSVKPAIIVFGHKQHRHPVVDILLTTEEIAGLSRRDAQLAERPDELALVFGRPLSDPILKAARARLYRRE